ncbi:MAG: S-adenosylmethionine decarboxylase [Gemmatimonadales bacterium]|nr:S-adenosylmethionine decarboxylase [Gemmatimonadales bacterium]
MDPAFNFHLHELTAISGARLADASGLSSVVVAAAGAVGMPPLGPPIVRGGPRGVVVVLLCRDGHIILHTLPDEGVCFVAVVARAPVDVDRGVQVISRGLARDGGRRGP